MQKGEKKERKKRRRGGGGIHDVPQTSRNGRVNEAKCTVLRKVPSEKLKVKLMTVGNYLKGPYAHHGSSLYLPNRVKLDQKRASGVFQMKRSIINPRFHLLIIIIRSKITSTVIYITVPYKTRVLSDQ